MAKSCFFIGHRDANVNIYPSLLSEVERHVTEYGVTDFFVGHYGSFDRMAAQAVKEVKAHYSEVRLIWCCPITPPSAPSKHQKVLTALTIHGRTSAFLSALPSLRPTSAWLIPVIISSLMPGTSSAAPARLWSTPASAMQKD